MLCVKAHLRQCLSADCIVWCCHEALARNLLFIILWKNSLELALAALALHATGWASLRSVTVVTMYAVRVSTSDTGLMCVGCIAAVLGCDRQTAVHEMSLVTCIVQHSHRAELQQLPCRIYQICATWQKLLVLGNCNKDLCMHGCV